MPTDTAEVATKLVRDRSSRGRRRGRRSLEMSGALQRGSIWFGVLGRLQNDCFRR
jgi:hypothetical protein